MKNIVKICNKTAKTVCRLTQEEFYKEQEVIQEKGEYVQTSDQFCYYFDRNGICCTKSYLYMKINLKNQ